MTDDDPHVHPFPWRFMALVAAIVIVATVVAGLVVSRNTVDNTGPTPSPSVVASKTADPTPVPVEERRQITVLVQVRDENDEFVSNALIGAGGGTGFVAEVLLPRDLLLPTTPPIELREADGPGGSSRAQEPLEALLGIHIDATLALDRLAWSGLLDALGDVVDQSTAARPASFPLVVDHVLAALPVSEQDVGQLLTSLGSMAQTSVTNEDSAHVLAAMGRLIRTQRTVRAVLPVTELATDTVQVSIAKQPETDELMTAMFPSAKLTPGHPGQVRVVLDRGSATVGNVADARAALADAGFGVVVHTGLPWPAARTTITVPSNDPEVVRRGEDVADALGLPESTVYIELGSDVDVRVVLGTDYVPQQ